MKDRPILIKTLFYVSIANEEAESSLVPPSLANILYQSRKANAQNNISGALAYHDKNYFQALEGPEREIDQLFENIRRDNRHRGIRVIYERETTFRLFSEHPMSLVNKHDQELFIRYINAYFLDHSTRSKKALSILSEFVDIRSIYNMKEQHANNNQYKNKNLSLHKWPRFTNTPSIPLVELCISLRQLPKSYEFHVNQNPFDSVLKLDESLDILSAKGCLIIEEKPKFSAYNTIKHSMHTSVFYKKMRLFLSSSKQ